MALFTSREDQLIQAITNQNPQIRFQRCVSTAEHMIKNALRKEPRLLAYLDGYEYSYVANGLSRDYDLILKYRPDCPAALTDVTLDTGSWDIRSIVTKGKPQDVLLVTKDPNTVSSKFSGIMMFLLSKYEGIHGWNLNSWSFEKLSDYSLVRVTYSYMMPLPQLRQYQAKASFAAKTIWRNILGKATVPQFVKPFLALSYIAQESTYDQHCYDELEGSPQQLPTDPIPHLAYGPLVEGRGICGGLAWAFKQLMDEARIECICVSGYLKEDTKLGHMWTMVKLDNQYYHVDPTMGSKDDGVFIGGLMQPDAVMRTTHIWEESDYPKARGTRFDYDFIEDYLVENGTDFIDAGANEMYFFPDKIVE